MNTFKFLFIFVIIVLYTSPEHTGRIKSENYHRVVAAHLNL
jgi:hypothetical protein